MAFLNVETKPLATNRTLLVFLGTLIDALIYLNDENERTEDCVAIRACYSPPPSTHDQTAPSALNEVAKRDAEVAIEKARRGVDSGNQATATQAGAKTVALAAEGEDEPVGEAKAPIAPATSD